MSFLVQNDETRTKGPVSEQSFDNFTDFRNSMDSQTSARNLLKSNANLYTHDMNCIQKAVQDVDYYQPVAYYMACLNNLQNVS
jgi:hypothetical protein